MISGTGNIKMNGVSTLTLTGNNTYTGTTTINSGGTLAISGAGQLGGGNYSKTIDINGLTTTFLYNSTNNQILSGVIGGNGVLTKNNTSTLTLSGNNTYSGATTISAGTLEIGGAGLLGGGNYSANIAINGATSAFLYNSTSNQTLGGIISGTG
ncbi:hypothetical protein EBU02_14335, partial [bacterium]|nr:hypothetical protein [bacterium]